MDVERIRTIAWKRQQEGRLVPAQAGMTDPVSLAPFYEAAPEDLVRADEAAELAGLSPTNVKKLTRQGVFSGRRVPTMCEDGCVRRIWYVAPEEVLLYAEMDFEGRKAARRGEVSLADLAGSRASCQAGAWRSQDEVAV